ncbi:HAD family hydrolase [Amycolatopsis sp. H20-H5]|uniref:HAD family hydrolase n=1 Tax=Amycolatopsis sp. H20-H5 TaxID=3046309 RepID=UPI002DB9F1D8|nr:HAD-IB family hydrolase [Amycolatopsis sp. H20-H5]MEC3977533.1 HAD-IB family hydrolase [Amycolatopsis sp. H20-H5]
MRSSGRAAFFDVDETVIKAKSMFDFLRFWLDTRGDDGTAYERAMSDIKTMAADDVPRSEINRSYYRLYTGSSYDELLTAGRAWYAAYRTGSAAFVKATVRAVEVHRAAGDSVGLVSGSFPACLRPLAEDLGADVVLCTEPVVGDGGLLTGEVVTPMIGAAKASAVAATISGWGFSAAECFGYGDHATDLDMLSVVGNPRAVEGDPVLVRHARARGWPILSAQTGPLH